MSPQTDQYCSILMQQGKSMLNPQRALAAHYLGFMQSGSTGAWVIVTRDNEIPFVIADTNYVGPESLVFGIDLDPECRNPLLMDQSGLPIPTSSIPWRFESWKLFEFIP